MLGLINRQLVDWLSAFFGLSSIFLTIKMFIVDQVPTLPDITNGTPLVVVLGTYLSLVLTALWKQSTSIKNIDDNIEKQQKHIQETLDVLKVTLKKDDEKHEAVVKLLKNIDDKEDKQVNLLTDRNIRKTR